MEVRFNATIEATGGFRNAATGSPEIPGRLLYDPENGITLELVDNPMGSGYHPIGGPVASMDIDTPLT